MRGRSLAGPPFSLDFSLFGVKIKVLYQKGRREI